MEEVHAVESSVEVAKLFAMALSVTLGVTAPAIGIGMIVSKALDAIGRNPEAANKITPMMFVGVAFTEALAIFAVVIAFIIKFV